jgi:cell fate regulator YaaT (PSP1 superfamily)
MPNIIGVKFNNKGKLYYYDPKNFEFEVGDGVVVETPVGVEYAFCCQKNTEIKESDLKAPLKEIIRKADEKDKRQYEDNIKRAERAFSVALRKVEKHKLPMKLINAEYTLDKSKVLINYTAENRVDFRALVPDLGSELRCRVELKQVYDRDDVKLRGAMGLCGQECCCIRCPSICEKSTVKMAKIQNISINPSKIGGMCGKLMCCLKFENEYYVELLKKLPKVGANIKTEDGISKVKDVNVLREYVTAITEIDGSSVEKRYEVGQFELMGDNRRNQKDDDEDIDPEIKNME